MNYLFSKKPSFARSIRESRTEKRVAYVQSWVFNPSRSTLLITLSSVTVLCAISYFLFDFTKDGHVEQFSALSTFVTLLLGLVTLIYFVRFSRANMQATLLLDFARRFEELGRGRYNIAKFALENECFRRRHIKRQDFTHKFESVPFDLWQIMDLFDQISMYSKRSYLDREMVFIAFFYWMVPYWECFKFDVMRMQHAAPLAMYHEIPKEIARLQRVGPRLGVSSLSIRRAKTSKRIEEFLLAEMEECEPSSDSSGQSAFR